MAVPNTFAAPAIPLAHLFISIAMYTWAVNTPRQKWLWLAPLLGFQYLALATADHWPNNGVDSIWGLLVCIWISHSLSVLFLEDPLLELEIADSNSGKRPWYWKAWKTWNNPRLLGTWREEKGRWKSPDTPQSRLVFVAFRLAKLLIYWAISHYIQPLLMPGAFAPFYTTDFDTTRQTYFRRLFSSQHEITARETALRATFAVFWAWGAYALADAAHAALSALFVGILRVDLPYEWPPLFGHLREAHSLRGFWGRFWHRLVVLPYGNLGKWIAESFLGLTPGSVGHKSVVAFAIFLLSGVSHAVVAYQLGDRCGWHLDIWWFSANFALSAAESFVLRWTPLRSIMSKCQTQPSSNTSWLQDCIGFLWVFLFFFWSVPKWQYPKIHCMLTAALSPETSPN